MKLHKTRRMVRVLSMVLVVAMLLSAMMVQAFAGTVTKTIQGYTARAIVGVYGNDAAYGEMLFDVAAALEMRIYGEYTTDIPYMSDIPFESTGSAHHYQLTVIANEPNPSYYVDYIDSRGMVGYNGSTEYFYPSYN